MLYVKVLKAIYGLIESVLIWYDIYSKTLMDLGFKLNPYDKCLANKTIDDKQCTVCWYIDNNAVSHVLGKVCKTVIDIIKSKFEGKFTRNTGDEHTFLGMDISFLGDGKAAIATPQHMQEVKDGFREPLN